MVDWLTLVFAALAAGGFLYRVYQNERLYNVAPQDPQEAQEEITTSEGGENGSYGLKAAGSAA